MRSPLRTPGPSDRHGYCTAVMTNTLLDASCSPGPCGNTAPKYCCPVRRSKLQTPFPVVAGFETNSQSAIALVLGTLVSHRRRLYCYTQDQGDSTWRFRKHCDDQRSLRRSRPYSACPPWPWEGQQPPSPRRPCQAPIMAWQLRDPQRDTPSSDACLCGANRC